MPIDASVVGVSANADTKNVVKRYPRKVKRYKRNILESNKELSKILEKVYPLLYKEANKFYKPYHIDNEDLIQEAYIKILKNKNKYDCKKNASVITWMTRIAINQFIDVLRGQIKRDKRQPGINCFDEIEKIDFCKKQNNNNDYEPELNIIEKQLICQIKSNLSKIEKDIFSIMIEPPKKLVDSIIYKNKNKTNYKFKLTSEEISKYINVKKYKVDKAKKNIQKELLRVLND